MILTREFTSALALRDDGDGRTLHGPVLPWNVKARVLDRGRLVVEVFERGALAGTDPGRVPLTATHPRDAGTLPIGVTMELEERHDAAWGAWRVSDTALGNEVLALARDGVPLGLSVGFAEVAGGSRWSPDRRRVTRTRALLDHVAVVRVPAYVGPGWWASELGSPQARPWPSSPWPAAVGKNSRAQLDPWVSSSEQSSRHSRCVSCKRRVIYGERCEGCKRELRQRQRRKPR